MQHFNYCEKPLIVFWEMTKACDLQCCHCRAQALSQAQPGELSTAQSLQLIEQICQFEPPYPLLILTGGDPLKKADFWPLLAAARQRGLTVAVSPAVTGALTPEAIKHLAELHVAAISLSLDGLAEFHDKLRGRPGTYQKTLEVISQARENGLAVQINTTVMSENYEQLPELFAQLKNLPLKAWEVFFLISTGRGSQMVPLTGQQSEIVCQFLAETSRYGITVRTVEAPFYRRVAATIQNIAQPTNPLVERLHQLLPLPTIPAAHRTAATRDGHGLVFVSHSGKVAPSGFLPIEAGDILQQSLPDIYRHSPVFAALHAEENLKGRCHCCRYRSLCGGSRARAWASSGDYLAEDPACIFQPA